MDDSLTSSDSIDSTRVREGVRGPIYQPLVLPYKTGILVCRQGIRWPKKAKKYAFLQKNTPNILLVLKKTLTLQRICGILCPRADEK